MPEKLPQIKKLKKSSRISDLSYVRSQSCYAKSMVGTPENNCVKK